MLIPGRSLWRPITRALDLVQESHHPNHDHGDKDDDDDRDNGDDSVDDDKYDDHLVQVILFNAERQTKVYALEDTLHQKSFT